MSNQKNKLLEADTEFIKLLSKIVGNCGNNGCHP